MLFMLLKHVLCRSETSSLLHVKYLCNSSTAAIIIIIIIIVVVVVVVVTIILTQ
jgi:hypothetical protein